MLGRTSMTKFPSTGARAKSSSPTAAKQQPDSERQPDPEAHDELGREPDREGAHDQVPGQEREPDLERAVAEHELEVERGEEEPGEHRSRPEDADDVRDRDVAQPEEAERHERRRDARLDDEEGREQRGRPPRAGPSVRGRQPADLVPVHDRVDGDHQRDGHGDRARDVEALRARSHARRRDAAAASSTTTTIPTGTLTRKIQCQFSDVGEDAAEEHADRAAAGGDEAEDPHRLRALGRLGEERHHQRERDRGDDRARRAPAPPARRPAAPARSRARRPPRRA